VGCYLRWDYLTIGCPLGVDREKENPEKTKVHQKKKITENKPLKERIEVIEDKMKVGGKSLGRKTRRSMNDRRTGI
jgi:hypothetical protein